jgi:hypothetical protein
VPSQIRELQYLLFLNGFSVYDLTQEQPVDEPFSPGERVRIRAIRYVGSARLLHGLTGDVVGPHPIAKGWYKIRLDPNKISKYTDWCVPGDRLVPENKTLCGRPPEQKTMALFP